MDQSRTPTPDQPGQLDEASLAAFDRQRAKVLRKRIQWYAILAMAMLGLSLIGVAVDVAEGKSFAALRSTLMTGIEDALLIGLFGGALVYVTRAKPPRDRLVKLVTVLTIAAVGVGMVMENIVDLSDTSLWISPESTRQARINLAFKIVLVFGIFFTLACVLIPMAVRESMRIVLGCFALFVVVALALFAPPASLMIWMTAAFAGLAAPGVLWSRWRYREFDDRFKADKLKERYLDLSGHVRELSAELTQARRLHEALFPPPLRDGPVRVDYRYEPMREIGGDFLYMNREPDGSASIVVIDVSGHGIPAALAVNRLHGELQRFFMLHPQAKGESGRPGHLLADLNAYAYAALAPQGMFATALCLRADAKAGTLEWASAGHPTAFLRRDAAPGAAAPNGRDAQAPGIIELASTATMLGVLDADLFHAEASATAFAAGEVLLAYTDGASEARSRAGEDLGPKRIAELLATSPSAQPLAGELMRAVVNHRAGTPSDDTLIVEIRRDRHATRAPNQAQAQAPTQVEGTDLTESRR